MKNTFYEGQHVMNNKTGKAYMVTTDTVQTRDRHQLVGTGIRNPELTRVAGSHLTTISPIAAILCFEAEKILRGKHKQSVEDQQILAMHRALKQEIVK